MNRFALIGGPSLGLVLAMGCGGRIEPGSDGSGWSAEAAGGRGLATAGGRHFDKALPHGNQRACATCHAAQDDFTLTPAAVEARYLADPSEPLFRSIDADDFAGDYTTLRRLAVLRIGLPLPPGVTLTDDPGATTASVWRGVPAVFNVALSAPYLSDGRADTLEAQVLGAASGHSQARRAPPDPEVRQIAAYERTVFSSPAVAEVARALAEGRTPPDPDPPLDPTQARGRAVFVQFCGGCHGGPLLDEPPSPAGGRFRDVSVSRFNNAALPVQRFTFTLADGTTQVLSSPDPGRALITGQIGDFERFDIPQLRGVARTAPYFHDNSAATLEDVVLQYNRHFASRSRPTIAPEDIAPLVEYLKVL